MDVIEYASIRFQVNLNGTVIQYRDVREFPSGSGTSGIKFENSNNSRINRQKRAIANATAYLQKNARYKPLVFVLTAPSDCDYKEQSSKISKFFNNLRKPHNWDHGFYTGEKGKKKFIKTGTVKAKCENYLWVREYQSSGRPHWHCIADLPWLSVQDYLQPYWSKLWGVPENNNSVRLHQVGKRFITDSRFSQYLVKYFNKNFSKEKTEHHVKYTDLEKDASRKFAISSELQQLSKPVTLNLVEHEHIISKILQKKKGISVGNGVFYYV